MTMMYKITGVDTRGHRFKAKLTSNYKYAISHNVYRGTLWECDNVGYQCGKPEWRIIHRWYNW